MRASALVLGLFGLVGTFAPDALLLWLDAPVSALLTLLVQVLGALYLGFAGLNWMARDQLIGGIYSRPVAVGNLLHFLTAALAAIKLLAGASHLPGLWLFTLVYAVFAIGFSIVLFRHPLSAAPA
jgi:hypothetical protein